MNETNRSPFTTLRPIKESTDDYEVVEEKIKALFRKLIYTPILKELGYASGKLQNALDDLLDEIRTGRITFYRGTFSGRFSAQSSKELKRLGARWDRKQGSWKLPQSSLPIEVRNVISASEFRFQEKLAKIDEKLRQILPDEIAGSLSVTKSFEHALGKVERDFQDSVRGITVAPNLSSEEKARIASEWQNNLKLYIKDFTAKEILKLRADMKKTIFAGDRYGSAVKTIQASYGVSENKAKFLARQETSLLMTKFKQTRYESAGVMEYKWGRVAGSKLHPVRPVHKKLAEASDRGKIYRWDDPPITTPPDETPRRNNPGQDYNCRCFAKPVVRFKRDDKKL